MSNAVLLEKPKQLTPKEALVEFLAKAAKDKKSPVELTDLPKTLTKTLPIAELIRDNIVQIGQRNHYFHIDEKTATKEGPGKMVIKFTPGYQWANFRLPGRMNLSQMIAKQNLQRQKKEPHAPLVLELIEPDIDPLENLVLEETE